MKLDREISLCIDAKSIMDNKVHPETLAIAIDILRVAWWPTKQAFTLNLKSISKKLNNNFPNEGYNEKLIKKHINDVKVLLVAVPGGKWLPNSKYFNLDNQEDTN